MPISPSKASSGKKRRWNAPPPLTRGTETVEGSEIFAEADGALAVLLWRSARNVNLWAATDSGHRSELFGSGAASARRRDIEAAGIDGELAEPFATLSDLLSSPGDARSRAVSKAARAVGRWAEGREMPVTALLFTQAAALAAPDSAEFAQEVGTLARQIGQDARAESWFRHSITLGRQSNGWAPYARAYIGLGELQSERQDLAGAHQSLIKAMRAARRKGFRDLEHRALGNLETVARRLGRNTEAKNYAKEAAELEVNR